MTKKAYQVSFDTADAGVIDAYHEGILNYDAENGRFTEEDEK